MRIWFILAAAAVAAGCAAGPEPVAYVPPVEHFQEVMVQTIPRGCWVEHNSGYVGVAPIAVRVRTSAMAKPETTASATRLSPIRQPTTVATTSSLAATDPTH